MWSAMRGRSQELWVDTETSGLIPGVHGIVQIAGYIKIDHKIEETFDFKCRLIKGDKISKRSIQSHGFTKEEIRKFPKAHIQFTKIVKLLREYVDPADKRDKFTMYAYNANFDYDFLRAWWEKNDSPFFGSYVYRKSGWCK